MVVGISFDTPAENLAFKEKFAFPYDLLCDVTRRAGLAYGVADSATATYAARNTYLIDPQGLIEKVYLDVDPASDPDTVLRDLG